MMLQTVLWILAGLIAAGLVMCIVHYARLRRQAKHWLAVYAEGQMSSTASEKQSASTPSSGTASSVSSRTTLDEVAEVSLKSTASPKATASPKYTVDLSALSPVPNVGESITPISSSSNSMTSNNMMNNITPLNTKRETTSTLSTTSPLAESSSAKKIASTAPATPSRVVLALMAPRGMVYAGTSVLQCLLSHGFRHGDDQLFLRYQHPRGKGIVTMRVAAATRTGTFNLATMSGESFRGLYLFTDSDDPNIRTSMQQIAHQMLVRLGGQLLEPVQSSADVNTASDDPSASTRSARTTVSPASGVSSVV